MPRAFLLSAVFSFAVACQNSADDGQSDVDSSADIDSDADTDSDADSDIDSDGDNEIAAALAQQHKGARDILLHFPETSNTQRKRNSR